MSQRTPASVRVHLSKTIIQEWRRCRLQYRFDRVDSVGSEHQFSEAQARGSATHDAIAQLLLSGVDPESDEAVESARAVAEEWLIDDADRVADWTLDALDLVAARGGRFDRVEDLVLMDRIPNTIVWAKFDVVVLGGSVAPIEVIDWKTGARPSTEDELLDDIGVQVYRLVAGHLEPDRSQRPIAITEVHLPTGIETTVVPTDDHVIGWFAGLKAVADEIRTARIEGSFDASPGAHCGFCPFLGHCDKSMESFSSRLHGMENTLDN